MCGIAGIRRFDDNAVSEDTLRAMATVLHHRGPDESATWRGDGVGLAHTRLSIIDLAGSHQPMTSPDGRWVLVFNGEIFNYQELRLTLDYPFTTHGDTEVVLAGLTVVGPAFVERLRGQFAYAAFDTRTGETHLARDRLGVLPLHYSLDHRALVFGSEIKALHAAGVPRRVDEDSLDAYLTARAVPAPYTLFAGVRKLPPGHRARVSRTGELQVERYWAPPPSDPGHLWTPQSAVDAVDVAVTDAVAAAQVADVPIGCYLSGGVDSSLIAAVMQRLRGGAPVTTFAAGFGDPRLDELPWARRVSEHVGTDHHEVHLRADDFEDLWPRLSWHRDAPISEPADIAVFGLARAAREQVRVVLSGEGGDELFGGYPKHRFARPLAVATVAPASLRRVAVDALEPRLGPRFARARIAVRAAGAGDEREQLSTWFAPFTTAERRQLLGGRPVARCRPDVLGGDALDRMLRHDLGGWLPDNLLERGDRMSMAASLELRPPLLDHHLVELAFRLPSSVKVRRGVGKWVLKEVARRYLPAEVVDRRKVGFKVPLDQWFRTDLRDSMWERLTGTDSFVGQTLDRRAVHRLLERHDRGVASEESRIWTLMCLEVWHESFFRSTTDA
ncbi:asparagine synthase (glutamine-hydrolyzing) [Nocardioides allogilvus]|uniref:asparagine synthase (glutamine-hydrolyzing) n=1 Tax=Nocardioides allogilvus TaxID=2072017 RepID=UPI000D31548A|nr:asparagine synthase (glutamine-hydrolyzing) [Nocardioides allogilvus]